MIRDELWINHGSDSRDAHLSVAIVLKAIIFPDHIIEIYIYIWRMVIVMGTPSPILITSSTAQGGGKFQK